MADATDLAARRWASARSPNAYAPRAMLVEAIRQIDAGELNPRHAILVLASTDAERGTIGTDWLQAGDANVLEQRGMLAGAQIAMFGSGVVA